MKGESPNWDKVLAAIFSNGLLLIQKNPVCIFPE